MRFVGALVVVPVLLLTGCGGAQDADGANEAAAAEASASATPTPTPTPTPQPDADQDGTPDSLDAYPDDPTWAVAQTITVECDIKGGRLQFVIDRIRPDFSQAWSTPLPEKTGAILDGVYCESYDEPGIPVSDVERKWWAADKRPNDYTITIPYEQCVEHGTAWTTKEWPVGAGQIEEAERALALCPDHPDAKAIRGRIAAAKGIEQQHRNGTAFYDGNHRVGTDVQPGTYYVEDVEDCYWERLDSRGEIIDNNFIPSGLRVEATIGSGDFSFHSENCGEWLPVD